MISIIKRNLWIPVFWLFCLIILTLSPSIVESVTSDEKKKTKKKYNVLYILSDDMRADLGSYGLPVFTPFLDQLASESIRFEHAYCQIAVCAPSRMSFMTGLRPDTNKVWNFIDENPLESQSIPGHFKDLGYLTLGLGKTFHQQHGTWNANKYYNTTGPNGLPYFPYGTNTCPVGNQGGGQCILPDDQIWDYTLRLKTLEYLRHAANVTTQNDTPFFLMTGFRDPHAPWAAPQRMYDLYQEHNIDIPQYKTLGNTTPLIAWSSQLNVCLANGKSFHYNYNKPVPDWVLQNQRHAYYASVSYVDEHIGAILAELDDLGLKNSTIIVFHADHGYALGEHGYWEKKSNFDLTVRVPLIIHVPGVPAGTTPALFDLVDVFPTLATLAGVPLPKQLKSKIDGLDLSYVIMNGQGRKGGEEDTYSTTTTTTTTKGSYSSRLRRHHGHHGGRSAAYHQYPACNTPSFNSTRKQCNNVPSSQFDFMGYSIRTHRWRYTCWYHWNNSTLDADWDGDYADELYYHYGDHSTSMDRWENENLSATRHDVAQKLKGRLESFFRQQRNSDGNDHASKDSTEDGREELPAEYAETK